MLPSYCTGIMLFWIEFSTHGRNDFLTRTALFQHNIKGAQKAVQQLQIQQSLKKKKSQHQMHSVHQSKL